MNTHGDKRTLYRGQQRDELGLRRNQGCTRGWMTKGTLLARAAAGVRRSFSASLPPTCTYHEQVLALWLQVGHDLLQPLPGPLGETALIVRQLGDSWPHGFIGCPQGPKDTKELVNLRVARKQGFAGHLERGRGEGVGSTPLSCRIQYQKRGQTREAPPRYLSQGCAKNPGLFWKKTLASPKHPL